VCSLILDEDCQFHRIFSSYSLSTTTHGMGEGKNGIGEGQDAILLQNCLYQKITIISCLYQRCKGLTSRRKGAGANQNEQPTFVLELKNESYPTSHSNTSNQKKR
jgi:hypothetical protein